MDADIIYENLLSHFTIKKRGEKSSQCLCPCHNDKQASLTISKGDKCVLVRCHAGCNCKDIVQSVGLQMKDLFYDAEQKRSHSGEYSKTEKRQYWLEHNYIDVYHYYNIRTGQYSYTKYRMPNKQFPQGIYKNKVWHDGLNGISEENKKLSFFCSGDISDFKKQAEQGGLLLYCEGEKDCRTCAEHGYLSFTLGSKEDWKSRKEVFQYLKLPIRISV